MVERRLWIVDISEAATVDIHDALRWSAERFGEAQAHTYEETIFLALEALLAGPRTSGVRPLNELMPGLMSLHIARRRRKGRHVILFHLDPVTPDTIRVVRLLHDSMDFTRHLSAAADEPDGS